MSVELVYDVGWVAPSVDSAVDELAAMSIDQFDALPQAVLDELLDGLTPPPVEVGWVGAEGDGSPSSDGARGVDGLRDACGTLNGDGAPGAGGGVGDRTAAGPGPKALLDPIDGVVADLGVADRAMARVLRGMAVSGPRDGLSVRRLVGLLAGATGVDVGFVDRAVEVLRPMPQTQAAFDDGLLSWSQVRGIVLEARRLSVAQREVLDGVLAGTVVQARDRGEPDRVVEVAGDLAARLDERGQEQLEAAQERAQRVVLQPDFDGWGDIHGTLGPEVFASTAAALDVLADAPVAADAPPVRDDDGRVLPVVARPATSRSAQLAEALGRMAALVLGGSHGGCGEDHAGHAGEPDGDNDADGDSGAAGLAGRVGCGGGGLRRARPRAMVIARLADLLAAEQILHDRGQDVPTAADVTGAPVDVRMAHLTSRLLLRRGNGRRRISRALTQALADDADLVPVLVDDGGMPVAIGDSYSPITPAMRRAVIARDQGCRAPGCSAPPEHCDVHHLIPRELGGPTELANLALMCRACHTRITRHRWRMRLGADGVLTVRIGRHTFTTRPRLTDPRPRREPDRRPGRPDQPVTP